MIAVDPLAFRIVTVLKIVQDAKVCRTKIGHSESEEAPAVVVPEKVVQVTTERIEEVPIVLTDPKSPPTVDCCNVAAWVVPAVPVKSVKVGAVSVEWVVVVDGVPARVTVVVPTKDESWKLLTVEP